MRSLNSEARSYFLDSYNSSLSDIPKMITDYDNVRMWVNPEYQTKRLGRWARFLVKEIAVTFSRVGYTSIRIKFTEAANFIKWTNIIFDELLDDLNVSDWDREYVYIQNEESYIWVPNINFVDIQFNKGGACNAIFEEELVTVRKVVGYKC